VSGFERTMATGAPEIGDDLVLSQPYRGKIVLTACDRVTGRETGAVAGVLEGSFVADLNAAHAEIIGPTIAIRFGAPYHAGPDAAIEVSETSGTLQGIRAAGKWEERVFGRITIARVPTLSVQANIFAFLKNSALILRAEEEIVLSGSFARAAS